MNKIKLVHFKMESFYMRCKHDNYCIATIERPGVTRLEHYDYCIATINRCGIIVTTFRSRLEGETDCELIERVLSIACSRKFTTEKIEIEGDNRKITLNIYGKILYLYVDVNYDIKDMAFFIANACIKDKTD